MCSRGVKSVAPGVVLAAILAGGCGGGEGSGIQAPEPVAIVTIIAPVTTIQVGEAVQLTATALDADGTALEAQSFEWTSGIVTVATVSPRGLVTGQGKGRSRIRATAAAVTGSVIISVEVGPPPD